MEKYAVEVNLSLASITDTNISYGFTNLKNVRITADPPTHPLIRTFGAKKICTPMNFHLSIIFIPNRKYTNGNITLIGRSEKL